MNNPVYISTGCFTGRINGRDPHLLSRFYHKLDCDGFELMMDEDLYPQIKNIIAEYRALEINIPVFHMNKQTGDLCSTPGKENLEAAAELVKRDAEIALSLGAGRCVFHPWGIPDSDAHPAMLYERMKVLIETGRKCGVELMPENCVCVNHSPLFHLKNALESFDFRATVDCRAAAFHGEVEKTVSTLPVESIGHFHIIDYHGAPGDWTARKDIRQPGEGDIDWDAFFDVLKARGCNASVTMEASHMLSDGVACEVLNRSVEFIRNKLRER